jgi:O-antigen ligase
MPQASEPSASAALALFALVALAVLSPWAFGGVTTVGSLAITAVSLGTALAVAAHQAWRGGVSLAGVPLWPLAVLLGLGLLQLVPLPPGVHYLLAPGSAAVWHPSDPASAALLVAVGRPVSIDPRATGAWLGMTGGLCALALLAAPALGGHSRPIRAAWILVAAGTLVAVYGVIARTTFGSLLYGHIPVPTVAPFGPFVNKNHFAGYVEMPALLALGLGRGLSRQAAAMAGAPASGSPASLVAFAAAAAMVMAVLLSMSRGAALGLASGLAVFGVLDVMGSRRRRPTGKVLVPAALVALVIAVLALVPGEVYDRLFKVRWREDSAAVFRLAIWKDSLRAWAASPVIGQGLGAFAATLPRFKTSAGLFAVEHPENEPIELAVEGGVIALAAAAVGLAVALRRATRAIKGHRDRVLRGIVTGAVAGTVALAVHGLVDFNLRIPSNAAMFLAMMAIAVAPLGAIHWRSRTRWALVAAIAAAGFAYTATPDPSPILRAARVSAAKAHATGQAVPAALRLAVAERGIREYVSSRPADPEGWLLAAWIAAAGGRPADAASLARHAASLDPARPELLAAARTFREGHIRR